MQNGDEFFPAMLAAINDAQKTINFEAYIFIRIKSDALCARARSGVQVRVLLDGIGSGGNLDNSGVKML